MKDTVRGLIFGIGSLISVLTKKGARFAGPGIDGMPFWDQIDFWSQIPATYMFENPQILQTL